MFDWNEFLEQIVAHKMLSWPKQGIKYHLKSYVIQIKFIWRIIEMLLIINMNEKSQGRQSQVLLLT